MRRVISVPAGSCTALILSLLVVLGGLGAPARADSYPRQPGIQVLHYRFGVELGDASDALTVTDAIDLRLLDAGTHALNLDLCNLITAPVPPDRLNPCLRAAPRAPRGAPAPPPPASSVGRGMTVTSVTAGGQKLVYTHAHDRLHIELPASARVGEELTIEIAYHGVPAEGLNIGVNRFGDRVFFTDNWPNKARNWLATIDHISVKATKTISVTAPAKYHVISNGLMTEDTDLGDGRRRTVWTESEPIPSWQFSLGVAQMAVDHFGAVGKVRFSAWIFPQDREAGFTTFENETQFIFEFYQDHIGPFAYEKLAQVEAALGGGATEPATTIFYYRGGYGAAAHEMAHHWFGDAVTESDWDDVWLSEGFATYFALLYTEHQNGHDAFIAGVRRARDSAMKYELAHPTDTVVHAHLVNDSDVFSNSTQIYQGGAMVLQTLRGVLGDQDFWAGIRLYYQRYYNKSASTDDLRRAMQDACIATHACPEQNRDLTWFFHEWLNRGGILQLNGGWHYDPASKQLRITLDQTQPQGLYRMPIQIGVTLPAGAGRGASPNQVVTMQLDGQHNTLSVPMAQAPLGVALDPDLWVPMLQAQFVPQN